MKWCDRLRVPSSNDLCDNKSSRFCFGSPLHTFKHSHIYQQVSLLCSVFHTHTRNQRSRMFVNRKCLRIHMPVVRVDHSLFERGIEWESIHSVSMYAWISFIYNMRMREREREWKEEEGKCDHKYHIPHASHVLCWVNASDAVFEFYIGHKKAVRSFADMNIVDGFGFFVRKIDKQIPNEKPKVRSKHFSFRIADAINSVLIVSTELFLGSQ